MSDERHESEPRRDDRPPEISSPYSPDDPPGAMSTLDEVEATAEAEGVIRSGKLAGRTMWSAIWILAMPVLIQQTMAAMLGLFDKVIAGSLPEDIVVAALDGIGIGSYIGWFIGIAMTGLGIGGQALIARAMGAGNIAEAQAAAGQSLTLSVVWGAVVGVLMWFGSPYLAAVTELSPDAAHYCIVYIRCLAIAMPFAGVLMVGSMCLHGAGETTLPSIIAIAINIVNVFVSWLLSGADIRIGDGERLINPFNFDLDVLGIAAGTAASYAVGALLTVWVMKRGVKDLKVSATDLPVSRSMVWRIVRIGLPNFCEGISMWAVNLFILRFIGVIAERAAGEGDVPQEGLQGAHIIAVQWEAFSFLPGFAIGTAAGALAGQYLGAGNAQMAQKAVLSCTAIAVVLMSTLGVIFMLFGEQLTRIVSDEAVHLEEVPTLLFICGTMQIFFAITMVIRQGLRGVGDTKWTFLITTASSYGARLPAAWFFGVYLGYGLKGIWIGLCGELCVRAMLFSARFFHGGWKQLKL